MRFGKQEMMPSKKQGAKNNKNQTTMYKCKSCGTPDDFEDVPTGKESKELKINKPKNKPTS